MVGDAVVGTFQILNGGANVDIRPPANQEWIIHNLYYGGACRFYIVDGGNNILVDLDTGQGARLGSIFHLTNGHYLQVKSDISVTLNFSYDGIVTREV